MLKTTGLLFSIGDVLMVLIFLYAWLIWQPLKATAQLLEETVGGTAALRADQGARASGMGGAFVAVSGDVNAPLWNPSAMAWSKKHTLVVNGYLNETYDSSAPMRGSAALVWPSKIKSPVPGSEDSLEWAIGASGVFSKVDDIEYRPAKNERSNSTIEWSALGMSFSAAGRAPIPWNGGSILLGLSYYIASQGFGRDNGIFSFREERVMSWSGFGASALLTDDDQQIALGLNFKKMGSLAWDDGHEDEIPDVISLGVSVRPQGIRKPFSFFSKTLFVLETRTEFFGSGKASRSYHGGAEVMLSFLALRGGGSFFTRTENNFQWSAGIGFEKQNFPFIDIAYVDHPFLDPNAIISMGFKF